MTKSLLVIGAALLSDLRETSAFESELGRIATTNAEAAKVQVLGDRVCNDYGALLDAAGPVELNEADMLELRRLAALSGPDFDDAFLDALESRSEQLRDALDAAGKTSGDRGDDALLRLARHTATQYANDARRVRGEYVPLSEDGR